jgi:membrane protein
MIDWGAALTFYAAISLIPALVILVGIVGVVGGDVVDGVADNLQDADPGPARAIALDALEQVRTTALSAGIALVAGIAGAIWSASSYVGCFLRGSSVIHESRERYPFWRLRPLQILITAGVILAIAATTLAVVVTGPLAEEVAGAIGLEQAAADTWDVLKWPAILAIVLTIFEVLYWAAPDARPAGFHWLTPGGLVATAAWALGSGGYALYVASFPDYNKVYGSLGAVVGFLAWLWLSNMAMMYGAELNALVRCRADAR